MIQVYNDGKQKRMSWEAKVELKWLTIEGYGANQEEAVLNLKLEASKVLVELVNNFNDIDLGPIVRVDGLGREIA